MSKSKTELFEFVLFNESNRALNKRIGETKLSETIVFGKDTINSKYVILGISEDIGPQMNGGFNGANLGFQSFVNAFQTIQSNKYCKGNEIGFLGEIVQKKHFTTIHESTGWVEELDEFVEKILNTFLKKEQVLIAIGGGHNNALPILRHINKVNSKKVQSINIDPHADCRSTEYRHSGNPFSFALNDGILESYAVFGLHESYNNQFIHDILKKYACINNTFEDFIDTPDNWWAFLEKEIKILEADLPVTLDIDLDSIAYNPSSALTPSGFSVEEIRRIIRLIAKNRSIQSLHLPEGAPKSETEQRLYGKMIAYFVLDFIKAGNHN
jgi:formiminoglutamase